MQIMKIKLLSMTLFVLAASNIQAAECDVTPEITFSTPEFSIQHYPSSSPVLSGDSPLQVATCDSPINIRSNFTPSIHLNSVAPFTLTKDDIKIEGSAISDPAILEEAKEYISQNFKMNFALKENSGGSNVADILNNHSQYNILPETSAFPNNTVIEAGEKFYTGEDSSGVRNFSMKLASASFSLSDMPPNSKVFTALNHTTLSFKIGTLRTQYKDATTAKSGQYTEIFIKVPLNIVTSTCVINVPNQIDLGSATQYDLNKNGSSNKKSFDINISCEPALAAHTQFKLTVQDMADVSAINTNGILTNKAPDKEKSNAVIQLINDITGEPFVIGKQIDYFSTEETSGSFKKTVSAQIYNSNPPTTVGKIEGRASFLINYE